MIVLSIDAGGTSTKCTLYDRGQELKDIVLESIHPMHTELSLMIETLEQAKKLIESSDTKIVLGSAGYGLDENLKNKIEQAMHHTFNEYQFHIVSDVELVLRAALQNKDGIFVALRWVKREARDVDLVAGDRSLGMRVLPFG